jgi:SOS-response transcriptional repressor LexA
MNEKESLILGIIRDYIAQRGYSPTQAEIGARANTSATTVAHIVARLELRGFLEKNGGGSRNIKLLKKEPEAA